MFRHRPQLLLAAAVTVLALAAAPAANADSIVSITKDGNVQLTSPDGSRGYQVTFDGGYSSPSQADDGTIAALHGKSIVRMDRSGRPLNAPFAGMGTPPDATGSLYGPYEPRISPDGQRIAYWFGTYTSYYSPPCYCNVWDLRSSTTWTWSDRFTAPSTDSEYYKGITQPEWLTNDRILAGYPDFWMSGWTWKIGTGNGYTSESAQWWYQFTDAQNVNFFPVDPALSPDGTKLALTNGSDPTTKSELMLASVAGPAWQGEPPYTNDYSGASAVQQPEQRCRGDVGKAVNPTWSPDSTRVAVGENDGIHVYGVPAGIDCDKVTDVLAIPGAAEPDWGPADVDLRQKPSPPPAGAAGPGSGTRGTASGTPAAGVGLTGAAVSPASFRARHSGPAIAARRTGTTVRFSLSAPAKVTLTVARRDGRVVRGSIRTAGKPGLNRLRFFGRIGGRTLAPGAYRLTIRATGLAGGRSQARVPFRVTG